LCIELCAFGLQNIFTVVLDFGSRIDAAYG
jgi:hypothetical protein